MFFLRKVDEIEQNNNEIHPTTPLFESTSSNTDQSSKIVEPKISAPYPQAGKNETSLYF